MKLYISYLSPYVRKVRMVVIEKGLSDQVEMTESAPYDKPDELVTANPLSKVPALIRDDGTSLFDSPVICEYLDSLTDVNPLLPASGEARWQVLRLLALSDGITDAAYLATMERRRPGNEQSDDWVAAQRGKIARGLDALEKDTPAIDAAINLGALGLGAALGYVDLRHGDLNWRDTRPGLASWFEALSTRQSFSETVPPA
jgi:glutathione S-transferase